MASCAKKKIAFVMSVECKYGGKKQAKRSEKIVSKQSGPMKQIDAPRLICSTCHIATYDSLKLIFEKIDYSAGKWDVSGDFKVAASIMGLQLGCTRNMCFICTRLSQQIDITREDAFTATPYKTGSRNQLHQSPKKATMKKR